MFFRLLLLLPLLLLKEARSLEHSLYAPVLGYSAISDKKSSPHLHGMQVGFLGWSFSEDFSVEVTGLGYLEYIKTQVLLPVVLPTPCTNALPKTPITTPITTPSATSPIIRPTTTASNMEEIVNPWKESPPIHHLTRTLTDLATQHSVTQDNFLLGTPESTQVIPVDIPSTVTDQSTEPAIERSFYKPKRTLWVGSELTAKCTFLHLSPKNNYYWALGITALYPLYQSMPFNYRLICGVGTRWILTPQLSIDGSYTSSFKAWNKSQFSESLLQNNTLYFFKLSLRWHFL